MYNSLYKQRRNPNRLKKFSRKTSTKTAGHFFNNNTEAIYNAHPNGASPRDVINISTLVGETALSKRTIFCKTCNKLGSFKKRHAHNH